MGTNCVSLINELQKIWNEVGEPEKNRDKMLFDLEQECLEAYRKKVDQASRFRSQLRQAVADSESKLAHICASLGEQSLPMKQAKPINLKKELSTILPQLEMLQKKKSERMIQFKEIQDQIHSISKELCASTEDKSCIDESDLSLRRLEEFKTELHALEKEKSDRIKQVLDHLNTLQSLCVVLGIDLKTTINEINPSLNNSGSKTSISADTFNRLSNAVSRLREIKIQRLQKVQDLATTMVQLWNLMDISNDEQLPFHNVTRYIAASENEVTEPNFLSLESIKSTETEISRLQQMKANKIMEVLLKKRADLEQICKQAHMPTLVHGEFDLDVEKLESGAVDPLYLLEQVEHHISNAKEEAFSRKDILDKIDKWLAACEEETWLEEYNMDQNRYNAGKGTHLLLKRAEKARMLVNKIPAMVETLREKAIEWEQNRGVSFSYDDVSLLTMLDDYDILKHEKEIERQRQRDQKKLQGQLLAEQEARFGSKPSPLKSAKRHVKASSMGSNAKRSPLSATKLNNPHDHYNSGTHAKLHTDKKNLGRSNLSHKQHESSKTERGNRTTPYRKPLSPVSLSLSSNANVNSTKTRDPKTKLQNLIPLNKSLMAATLSKTLSFADEENLHTPKTMKQPMPSTPPTCLMKMAMIPSTPFVPHDANGVEYSFEEIRLQDK
ncbi:65-kDa microtubule-associated protein 9-like [Rutidosis leptorrhynchoides]|uniref:65-kDa microtubule-associated protein 9-like n=1 Tax=Rutidosis leptorrhynchoides TaxID=125765 RepID=UPI003A997769